MNYALITGAGSGLGKALAIQYSNQGYGIILIGRRQEKLEETKSIIQQSGGTAETYVCDITSWDQLEALANQINQVDVLINNAGIGYFGSFEELEKEQIDTMLNVNVAGPIYTTKHLMPHIQKRNGRILNIISTAGLRGKVHESGYCASKFAQRGFTESLQKEYEEQNVHITAVYMGGMNTPFWEDSNYISDPSILPSPNTIAEQIIKQDDGRKKS
ncbi:SDR family NAD(P)-dependent oxidoreductase [Piscibacillus halophilus]|uniref:Short-chain dehydrogenase n=1 Tax=Piscibacillus halophilus TaxID=571933 RepID=A0A1H9GEJ4_9BACI|nr:SDR family oxidoreductase [Piscibacillus halophilus]SEQ48474.1 Short-chain dehydrogenase [Piscibacillus halophilus]